MNICLISQEYPPETNWGGIATYTQTLERQLVKMGQHVHVITLAEKDEYKMRITKLLQGFEARVRFIDNIYHAAFYPVIERSKFVVLPSLWENFPYACLEAMALGKPVVATTGGGFTEIIENEKEGMLCAPGDTSALKEGIARCLERMDLDLMGRNAKKNKGPQIRYRKSGGRYA